MCGRAQYQNHPCVSDAGTDTTELECPVLVPQESGVVKRTSSAVRRVWIATSQLLFGSQPHWFFLSLPGMEGAGSTVLEECDGRIRNKVGDGSPLWQSLRMKRT